MGDLKNILKFIESPTVALGRLVAALAVVVVELLCVYVCVFRQGDAFDRCTARPEDSQFVGPCAYTYLGTTSSLIAVLLLLLPERLFHGARAHLVKHGQGHSSSSSSQPPVSAPVHTWATIARATLVLSCVALLYNVGILIFACVVSTNMGCGSQLTWMSLIVSASVRMVVLLVLLCFSVYWLVSLDRVKDTSS
jgi:hypothetical protein